MISGLPAGTAVVLLDIEGTTTPLAFVHETLFPYARARLDTYLAEHWSDAAVTDIIARLAIEREAESGDAPPWRAGSAEEVRASAAVYLAWLSDRDRKSPALKALQGLIWEEAYRAGLLRGEVWDDVPRAIRRWREAGLRIAIYSSGSELAQRLLFSSTAHGDLTPRIDAFFDTSVGPKVSPESYVRIAEVLGCEPSAICFISDVAPELRAAREAGCAVVLSDRPGNRPQAEAGEYLRATSFDELTAQSSRG